jgi:hypothetical protein
MSMLAGFLYETINFCTDIMMYLTIIHVLCALIFSINQRTFAFPTLNISSPFNNAATNLVTVRQLHQFPKGTYVENLAVRSNGNLIITLLSAPDVYELNPFVANPSPTLIYTFPDANGAAGIVETSPDQFAILVVKTGGFQIGGSYGLWNLDLRSGQSKVTPIVVKVPGARLMNGLALLPSRAAVLSTDTFNGVIYRVDLKTGASNIAMDKEVKAGYFTTFGLNGLRIRDRYAYFTNTLTGFFGKIPIDPVSGAAMGKVDVLATGLLGVDDFALGPEADSAYISYLFKSQVIFVKNGAKDVVAGSMASGAINGPCSAQFGRTAKDSKTLYVVTSGQYSLPGVDVGTGGGKVVALAL